MYWNLGTKKIKKNVRKLIKNNEKQNTSRFIPDTKIIANQTEKINKVCPRSGWDNNKITIGINTKILIKYFKYNFFIFNDNINDTRITKKGFKISIGWNLGNGPKSSHLFEPFTSTPIIGTNKRDKNVIKNKKIDNLTIISWFIIDKKNN